MIVEGEKKAYQIGGQIYHCGIDVAMNFIGGKWKCVVLWYLRKGTLRFSELKYYLPDMTEKMLSLQLKFLQSNGLITRKCFGEKAPYRVEYQLTDFGKSLLPVIERLMNWGVQLAESKGKLIDV